MKISKPVSAALCAAFLLTGCGAPDVSAQLDALYAGGYTETMNNESRIESLAQAWKSADHGNPISADIYCADPTAVEYNGRLYVYGTNDHQQFTDGTTGSNTYETIKSFVVFSTDDMVNWVCHGTVNTGEVAPWIISSWAPSITSRVEEDGLTHFYLYFSNNGCGVGVITATDPLGPWSDPLGEPLIRQGMRGLGAVPNPFDPGVSIDANGTGWLTFGGGKGARGTDYMPGSARIVQLGTDMLSFASDWALLPAPYFYEASELNIIGDTFCYTYNTNWAARETWTYPGDSPSRCAMSYMTTKTPLDTASWVYRGDYFANPGDFGYPDSNNHTHLHKFAGSWYLLYHTLQREVGTGGKGGYRSLCVTQMQVDEASCTYEKAAADDTGAPQIKPLDPFAEQPGALRATDAEAGFVTDESGRVTGSLSQAAGAWLCVRGADFGKPGAGGFAARLSGKGTVEVRLDAPDGKTVGALAVDSSDVHGLAGKLSSGISGVHDLYFVFSDSGMALESWKFV